MNFGKFLYFYFRVNTSNKITYSNQSTATIKETSSAGKPIVSRTITNVTKPACGIPAAPILEDKFELLFICE